MYTICPMEFFIVSKLINNRKSSPLGKCEAIFTHRCYRSNLFLGYFFYNLVYFLNLVYF